MEIGHLPLKRDIDGQLQLVGTGPVNLRIDYDRVLGVGGQGVVFRGALTSVVTGMLVVEVAVKMHKTVSDPYHKLRDEAENHAHAWRRMSHVLRPWGFLAAHEASDTPAVLVMDIGVPFRAFLALAGNSRPRKARWNRAIARVVSQLMQFVVAGDAINLMHKDIKMGNIFVSNAHNLERARLAVGDFGGAQLGKVTAEGRVIYRPGVYTWDHTSPRMASTVYSRRAVPSTSIDDIELDRQLCFYNELFGWARVAYVALADRLPPDTFSGPSSEDYAAVPDEGFDDSFDAIHHMLLFALDLLTAGTLDDVADGEYVRSLKWYKGLPRFLDNASIG